MTTYAEQTALNLIAGEPLAGKEEWEIHNPAKTSHVVGRVSVATLEQVDDAAQAAAKAAPEWAAVPIAERVAIASEAAAIIEQRAGELGWDVLLTREQGKILPEAVVEFAFAQIEAQYINTVAEQVFADEVLEDGAGHRISTRVPIGPVAAITPWNAPVGLSALKLFPALICGNPIVLKPAPTTPLAITRVVESIAQLFPQGALSVVHGGADVAQALIHHDSIRKVSFTGSVANGKSVMREASQGLKDVLLELGGNDAAILLDDVVIDEDFIEQLIGATFMSSGQICMAIKRVYVPQSRHDEFVAALSDALAATVVGDGLDEDVTMGPVHNKMQYDRVRELVEEARAAGAAITPLGRVQAGINADDGYFLLPSVVTNVPHSTRLVLEEQFGPALPVIPYATEDEAVRLANSTDYGLGSSVWSADVERAFTLSRGLQAGATWINAHNMSGLDISCAFGGFKQSGIGREFGLAGLEAYTEFRYLTNRMQ